MEQDNVRQILLQFMTSPNDLRKNFRVGAIHGSSHVAMVLSRGKATLTRTMKNMVVRANGGNLRLTRL